MQEQIRCNKTLLRLRMQVVMVREGSSSRVSIAPIHRVKGQLAQTRFKPKPSEHSRRVGTLLNACTYACKRCRLFVDLNLDSEPQERRSGSQSADARAHDRDFKFSLRHP